jgi:hypothetical protein
MVRQFDDWHPSTQPEWQPGRLRLPPKAVRAAGRPQGAAAPLPPRGAPVAFREKTSERGGRSSWRLSGTLRQPPPSESHRRRPLLVPPRSHDPYPVVPVPNLTAGIRVHPSPVGPTPRQLRPWRPPRMCLFLLGGTPSTGRPTLYPEGVRCGAVHPCLPVSAYRAPTSRTDLSTEGAGRGRRRRRAGPSTRSRPMRCCTGQAEASRSRWSSTSTTTGWRRRSWIMAPSPRPAS